EGPACQVRLSTLDDPLKCIDAPVGAIRELPLPHMTLLPFPQVSQKWGRGKFSSAAAELVWGREVNPVRAREIPFTRLLWAKNPG
ncbi:hypothetical protein, partial [Thermogutta sp.]|uniref:hypothetical protein n=1 Tax=Thermogutta sp. TaxID=1962930 RepID=UPI0025EE11FE